MTSYVDRVIFLATAGTTGDLVVASAVTGYQTPLSAGAVNGATYAYAAELKNASGTITDWEVGRGVYTTGTVTLTRATILFSSNSNSPVNFSSAPNVMLTLVGEDIPTQSSGANPTATAGTTAVNGSATTFMRSDGAPAVTTATSAVLGIVQPDNSTITIAAGIITAASGSGANPTATGGSTAATNGSAVSFLRSDGAFAMQNATSGQKGVVKGDGATLSLSTGVISLNLASANTWTANITVSASTIASNGHYTCGSGVSFYSVGTHNVVIGGNGLNFTLTGNDNISSGQGALAGITSGSYNIGLGAGAGQNIQDGVQNVCLGPNAGQGIVSGNNNFAMGISAMSAGTLLGGGNVGIGASALTALSSNCPNNMGIGSSAMAALTIGSGVNVGIGSHVLNNLLTGTANVAFGNLAATNYSSAESYNVVLGGHAGTAGESNVIILSDGQGNLRLDNRHTTASMWTFADKITVPGGANALLTVTTTISTTGTSTNAGTLTNAPSVGNPTKWIAFNDNGTTRFIPAW